jgi:hypothetical protein
MAVQFQPPPTYADPVVYDQATRKQQFNPIWLKWFLDVAQYISSNGGGGAIQHNSLGGLQGGLAASSEFYHLTNNAYTILKNIAGPTAGAVVYGTGSEIAFTAAGSAGQVLTSAGAGVPIWTTLAYQPTAAPATYTANFSVATTDVWIINNKSGSSCTATLPTASSYTGRTLYFINYQAQTLVSASSNVVPLVGGAAGTAILNAVAGDTCTLVSNGTNWVMTQYTPNNVLLLE